jgi:hypothetical protein
MLGHDDTNLAEQLVPDEVWAAIQPLLPARRLPESA